MAFSVPLGGVANLFRGRPHHPVGPDGQMALSDHLRELRARILKATVALIVVFVVALFLYEQLLTLVLGPYEQAQRALSAEGVSTTPTIGRVTGPLLLQLKMAGVAAVVVTSPYWLYQLWAFIVPGLHSREKLWTRVFAAVAGPLFIAGVATAYYVLPVGIEVLIGFTPGELVSLVDFGEYFSFFTRMLLVFGVAFEIPLFVIMLNLAGVVSGKQIGKYRPWIVIGTFVFAAVATPSTDPFSMLMLALPMLVLFIIAEIVARFVDRLRARKAKGTEQWADDELSPL
ncbi:twin-arginine translocase subunit TatC [uncultured Nocardioides sp.]|uniref:twin-arginine translocase subunit TatC n=1 Tax=uncultured Nocardioides sp. TaxID=198441 RepID=UPI00262A78EA|nr:twin-arginine translocase subunit TatC [uncultured Nocardioides sp.]